MAKKKAAPAVEEDLLQDEGGDWKEHDIDDGSGSLEFNISDDPNDVTQPDNKDDEVDVVEEPIKKVAKKKDEEEDLLSEEEEDEVVEEEEDETVGEDEDEIVDENEEDELAAQEPGGDFLSPWEKKNYSKAMSGRVSRERRLKREAEDQAAAAQEETAGLRDRANKAEKLALDLLTERVEADIELDKAAIIAAKEEGDTAAEVEAQTKLQENLIKKREIERSIEAQPKQSAAADKTAAAGDPKKAAPPSPQLKRWVERNRWFTNPEFADEEGYARAIDAGLLNDPAFSGRAGSPAYFAELDRRIHNKMPALRGKIKKVFGTKPTAKVAGVDRGSASNNHKPISKRNPKKVVLTAEDIENARSFGITSPAELKEYAKNKFNRENEERQGSR